MNRYAEEKAFVKELTGVFGVSETGSRAGVISFSSSAHHNIKLGQHKDLASFNSALDDIPFLGNTTRYGVISTNWVGPTFFDMGSSPFSDILH